MNIRTDLSNTLVKQQVFLLSPWISVTILTAALGKGFRKWNKRLWSWINLNPVLSNLPPPSTVCWLLSVRGNRTEGGWQNLSNCLANLSMRHTLLQRCKKLRLQLYRPTFENHSRAYYRQPVELKKGSRDSCIPIHRKKKSRFAFREETIEEWN